MAEHGIPPRDIAGAIGRRLGISVTPVAQEDAAQHFRYLSGFVGLDSPTSSRITRDAFGWTPTRPGLIADIEQELDPTVQTGQTTAR